MKACELLRLLQDAPPGALVVVHGCDHNYLPAGAEITTALRGKWGISEDYGEDDTPEAEYGKRIPVVLISTDR
jgi:hypothetical protein